MRIWLLGAAAAAGIVAGGVYGALQPPALAPSRSTEELLAIPLPSDKDLGLHGADLFVSGEIARRNWLRDKSGQGATEDVAALTVGMLKPLGEHEIITSSPWTDGAPVFRGPLMRDLLAMLGAHGKSVVARARHGYFVEIPVDDFQNYDVILATSMNGKPLSPTDKGPLWIVYPRDQHRALRDALYDSRWIWSVNELEVK